MEPISSNDEPEMKIRKFLEHSHGSPNKGKTHNFFKLIYVRQQSRDKSLSKHLGSFMKKGNSPLRNSKSQKSFVIKNQSRNGFNNSVINPDMCGTLYNDSLKLVEKFYSEFQDNANMDATAFFKNYNKSELNNTFRELDQQKEFLNKMVGNIDRFITCGKKSIEKVEFGKLTQSIDSTFIGSSTFVALKQKKLKDCLSSGIW